MKVTKLTAQKKNPDRINIFVDGKYTLSLTTNQLLDQEIKIGKELDESDVKVLTKLSEDGKMRSRALEWVLSRPHSSRELSDYLFKKKADSHLSVQIQQEFIDKNYQNDEQFAKWWIDNRVRKNKSDLSIKTELRQKGVAQELIDEYLKQETSAKERLKQLIIKKRLKVKYPEEIKLKQYLAGKGFIYFDIAEVLAELNDGADLNF